MMTKVSIGMEWTLVTESVALIQFQTKDMIAVIVGVTPDETSTDYFLFGPQDFYSNNAALPVWGRSIVAPGRAVILQ